MNTKARLQYSLLLAICAVIIFTLSSCWTTFTFSTDDFALLHHAITENSSSFVELSGKYLARMPIQCIFSWIMYEGGIINENWLFLYLIIFIHSFILIELALYICEKCNIKIHEFNRSQKLFLSLSLITLCMYPSLYEVQYWASCTAILWGAPFLLIGLRSKNLLLRAIFMALSFLTSETYVLPAFCFLAVESLLNDKININIKDNLKRLAPWILAIAITLATREILGIYFSSFETKVTLTIGNFFHQLKKEIELLYTLHFYKIYYAITAPFLLALLSTLYLLVYKKALKLLTVILSILICIASGVIYTLIAYGASRALYGASLFTISIWAFYFAKFSTVEIKNKFKYIPLTVMLLAFLIHSNMIFRIKKENSIILTKLETNLVSKMSACNSPCKIELDGLDHEMEKDWVLHPAYWIFFARYLQAKNNLAHKDIEYIVIEAK